MRCVSRDLDLQRVNKFECCSPVARNIERWRLAFADWRMEQALLKFIAVVLRGSCDAGKGSRMSEKFDRKTMTPAEREARKLFREADAAKAMTEHERAQRAFFDNRERLKALRLAREAGEAKEK
jgi:hypothetical protein